MAFTDIKNLGDIIDQNDWNEFVNFAEDISGTTYLVSGNYAGHSGNKDIHYPSSQILDWLNNVYSPSGKTTTGFATVSHMSLIPHGLGALPTYANVVPSSSTINFGTSCKIDSDNITVYLTTYGSRDVHWIAKL